MGAPTLIAVAFIGVAMIMECDLGRHRITWFRLLRAPLVSIGLIVPLAPAPTLSGAGLAVEIAGVAIGILVGWLALKLLTVTHDGEHAIQRAGWPYAAVLLGFATIRSAFILAAEDVFPDWLGQHLDAWHISPDGFANGILYISLALTVTRTAIIYGRSRSVPRTAATVPAVTPPSLQRHEAP